MKTSSLPGVTRTQTHAAPRDQHPGEGTQDPTDHSRATGEAVLRQGDPSAYTAAQACPMAAGEGAQIPR